MLWNSQFLIRNQEKPKVEIEVYDWKSLNSSDFVGRANISSLFLGATTGRRVECWVQLKRNGVKITGAVHLAFHLRLKQYTPDPYVTSLDLILNFGECSILYWMKSCHKILILSLVKQLQAYCLNFLNVSGAQRI